MCIRDSREVIALAEGWAERTGGAFDPRLQPLIDMWDRAEQHDVLPTPGQLSSVTADHTSLNLNGLNVNGLNLNGIAKGWIADRAIDAAFATSRRDITSAWLSLGGDLVHRGTGSVEVGIEDPARPYDNVAPMATIEIDNEALATSGGARRWWTIGGKRYSKVLDPRTGLPVDSVASATVVARNAAEADVLATTALVLKPEETLVLVEAEGAECFLVLADGAVVRSSDRFRRV